MIQRHLILIVPCVLLAACADNGSPRDAGDSDSSRPDTGGGDTGTADTGGAVDSGGGDTGGGGIVVDGVVTDGEWAGATDAVNGVASGWGASNALTRIRAAFRDDRFFLAAEGQLEAGAENAIVVYLDAEPGGAGGVADPLELTDGEGALDNAVSAGITTPADLRVDFAWGTRDLDRAQDGFDDRMGWRDVATTPGDFAWLDAAEAPTVCGAAACETSIPVSTLGGAGALSLFGRLVNTDGTMISNQCVPEDDPDAPGVVSMVLMVPR